MASAPAWPGHRASGMPSLDLPLTPPPDHVAALPQLRHPAAHLRQCAHTPAASHGCHDQCRAHAPPGAPRPVPRLLHRRRRKEQGPQAERRGRQGLRGRQPEGPGQGRPHRPVLGQVLCRLHLWRHDGLRECRTTHHDVCRILTARQGITHASVTPLDLVKVRRQVDSKLYTGNFQAWGHIYRTEGLRGIFTGWGPTFLGYSAQGAFKYGWYEYFKKTYSDLAGPEAAYKYKTALYLSASASAEFLADIALCPFEAIKVRMQATIPAQYTGTMDGLRKIVGAEGVAGLYKGLYPLWGRQIPYTMMKFASFETIVEMIYARLPGSKSDYGKGAQTGVSFVAGYTAGILCAIVSHPADVMVSKLNAYRKAGEAFGTVTSRIYKDIGFRGLWNGLPVRIVMIGTLTGLQWMIYVSLFRGERGGGEGGADWFAGLLQDLYGLAYDGWCAAAGEVSVSVGGMAWHGEALGVLFVYLLSRFEFEGESCSMLSLLARLPACVIHPLATSNVHPLSLSCKCQVVRG